MKVLELFWHDSEWESLGKHRRYDFGPTRFSLSWLNLKGWTDWQYEGMIKVVKFQFGVWDSNKRSYLTVYILLYYFIFGHIWSFKITNRVSHVWSKVLLDDRRAQVGVEDWVKKSGCPLNPPWDRIQALESNSSGLTQFSMNLAILKRAGTKQPSNESEIYPTIYTRRANTPHILRLKQKHISISNIINSDIIF